MRLGWERSAEARTNLTNYLLPPRRCNQSINIALLSGPYRGLNDIYTLHKSL